ncbi:MAG: sigma-70 family RNA polymerase sigma factor [Firmicutes bacterium]|nr:sigma-70 family RNA polymerase sigma factor [Bacillota bacterium]
MSFLVEGQRVEQRDGGPCAQLEYLMRRFGSQVQRLAYYYLRDQYQAEDITQEVFYRVYKNLDRFRRDSSYYTWIYRITVNLCRDHLRSAAFRRLIPYGDNGALEMLGDKFANPPALVEEGEVFQRVMELPLKYRLVIALYYFQELNTTEIAQVLNITPGNVRTRLCRARAMLKESLKEGC